MYSRAVIYVISIIWFCLNMFACVDCSLYFCSLAFASCSDIYSVNGALTLMVWLFYGSNIEIIFEPEHLLMIQDMT